MDTFSNCPSLLYQALLFLLSLLLLDLACSVVQQEVLLPSGEGRSYPSGKPRPSWCLTPQPTVRECFMMSLGCLHPYLPWPAPLISASGSASFFLLFSHPKHPRPMGLMISHTTDTCLVPDIGWGSHTWGYARRHGWKRWRSPSPSLLSAQRATGNN